jgi:hypothetical protein
LLYKFLFADTEIGVTREYFTYVKLQLLTNMPRKAKDRNSKIHKDTGTDADDKEKGLVANTEYATAYKSSFTQNSIDEDSVKKLLHVNCSYLSNPGTPPTLLALKRHAQSLTILIRYLCPSTTLGEIDQENNGGHPGAKFRDAEAFDWLNDLSTPYENDDAWHHKPLNALINTVRSQSDIGGIRYHCPLSDFESQGKRHEDQQKRPFASHENLAMHANECLERLDHEYSATGGLLSILPTDEKSDEHEMYAARNSILGQWLLFTQHLVGRMHELEISYGNSLDILAGEAVVPHQVYSKLAQEEGAGARPIAYPQDKWILANAGEDVFGHLHTMLDRQEAQIDQKEELWKRSGVSGERTWMEERGGSWYARGLVPVDIMTRYYRLKEHGHNSSIFILPAFGEHPAVQQTRVIEERPTVVSVVTPTWPVRISEWEKRNESALEKTKDLEMVNVALREDCDQKDSQIKTMASELERANHLNEVYEQDYDKTGAEKLRLLAKELTAYQTKFAELRDKLPQRFQNLLDTVGGDTLNDPHNAADADGDREMGQS